MFFKGAKFNQDWGQLHSNYLRFPPSFFGAHQHHSEFQGAFQLGCSPAPIARGRGPGRSTSICSRLLSVRRWHSCCRFWALLNKNRWFGGRRRREEEETRQEQANRTRNGDVCLNLTQLTETKDVVKLGIAGWHWHFETPTTILYTAGILASTDARDTPEELHIGAREPLYFAKDVGLLGPVLLRCQPQPAALLSHS